MDNGAYQEALTALMNIAYDEEETPRRRRIAREAIEESSRGSGAAAAHTPSKAVPGHRTVGNHRGGYFLAANIDYEGVVE
jgi:hypothetical protein